MPAPWSLVLGCLVVIGAVVGVGRRIGRVAVEPGLDLRICQGELDRLGLGQAREVVVPLRRGERGQSEREGRERGRD